MGTRVENIITKARRILSDKNATRWTNDDLVDLLNEGLEQFVRNAKLLKKRKYLPLENDVSLYDLSGVASSIFRVQYLNKAIPSKLSAEMDRRDAEWEDTTGEEVECVIFDTYKSCKFKIYPKITADGADIYSANSNYGGLIDVTVTDDVTLLDNVADIAVDVTKYLVIFMIGKPTVLTYASVDDDVELDEDFDEAMVAYIAGQSLIYDQDTKSKELALVQLGIYDSLLQQARSKEAMNSNTVTEYTTEYRSF